MKKIKINYFQKMIISFTVISIIPIIILGSISYSFYTNRFTDALIQEGELNIHQLNKNLETLVEEYDLIIDNICNDQEITKALLNDEYDKNSYKIYDKIRLLVTGKKNKIELHIMNKNGTVTYSTSQIPDIYDVKIYREWGIFKKVNNAKDRSSIIYTHKYNSISGDYIVLSIARAVKDYSNKTIGYVIVDIYRSHIIEMCNSINNNIAMDFMILDEGFTGIVNFKSPHREGLKNNIEYQDVIKRDKQGTIYLNKNNIMIYDTSDRYHFITMGMIPIEIVMSNGKFLENITIIVSIICLFICIILAFVITSNVSTPIKILVKSMKEVEKGDLDIQVNFNRTDEIGVLGKHFNSMIVRIKELLSKIVEEKERLKIAEIEALQAQINPHFLYNTLSTIKSLSKFGQTDEIGIIVTELGKLLRSNINCGVEFVTVEENLKLIESYLKIQNIRHNGKFNVCIEIDKEIYKCKIPKLILQPIVENSIIHGLENKIDSGNLIIKGRKKDEDLVFEVIDDGFGMDSKLVSMINSGCNTSENYFGSIGIKNVQQRIKLYYGDQYGLQVSSEKNQGTIVTVSIGYKI